MPSGHLVYVREGVLMAVPFARARSALSGESVALVADVTRDGRRFLFVENPERSLPPVTHLVVVQDWDEELRRRVPVR